MTTNPLFFEMNLFRTLSTVALVSGVMSGATRPRPLPYAFYMTGTQSTTDAPKSFKYGISATVPFKQLDMTLTDVFSYIATFDHCTVDAQKGYSYLNNTVTKHCVFRPNPCRVTRAAHFYHLSLAVYRAPCTPSPVPIGYEDAEWHWYSYNQEDVEIAYCLAEVTPREHAETGERFSVPAEVSAKFPRDQQLKIHVSSFDFYPDHKIFDIPAACPA